MLTQLNTASTPSAVKEAAVRALDSIIRSSEEHASVVCNPEVGEGRERGKEVRREGGGAGLPRLQ